MSASGYTNMLEKYRDVDEDEIMSGLTKDELARLENEIDREILEKPPEYESYGSDAYTTATTTTDDSESEEDEKTEEAVCAAQVKEKQPEEPRPRTSPRSKPEAFAKGKLDKTQLIPVQKTLQRQKSGNKHTFKIPALKRTTGTKSDKIHAEDDGNSDLKDELIQAVKKRDKRRVKKGNSSGVARRPSLGVSKVRRNSKIARYRDGNEHQIDAATVNRNFITDEMVNLRPRLRKVNVKEPKLILPEELHGVSFNRITAGARRKEDDDEMEEVEPEPEPAISEDGNASRNSAFGYDADNDVTPSDDSYALPGEEEEMEEASTMRHKAMSESSEAPSDGVVTMASTTSTSADSCDVFGELSINPNSVEEMLERVRENDPMLTEVNLNNIHDVPMERFEDLAEAMRENTRVTSLSLANTGLTDRAAKALAAMLKKNKTLKKLNVESNFITGEGGRRLVSALRKNNSLIELSLDNQRHIFGAKVEFEMSKLLRENSSLLKFGYQFANPGPRMSASNILTKNMDIVRKRRVAAEKKRQQSGLPKRPPLRRQPSSEWYRKERLERLKKLQQQSKLLGMDPRGNIGDKEVEKVLKNMNPDEVSLLERWFTSKLLGMVDAPPTAKEENHTREEQKKEENPRRPPKDNLLRPPSRSRRSKSPVASRDNLMDSIRKQNARLKKVQLRPFESPERIGNTDSGAEVRSRGKTEVTNAANELTPDEENRQAEQNARRDRSISEKPLSTQPARSPADIGPSSQPQSDKPSQSVRAKIVAVTSADDMKAQTAIVRPTVVKTEPSFEKLPLEELKYAQHSSEGMFTASDAEILTHKSEEASRDEDESQQRSPTPEIQEWKEGEEYDSDEYEVVEIEVTDSDDEGEENDSDKVDVEEQEAKMQQSTPCDPRSHLSPSPNSDQERDTSSPRYKSSLSARLARNRPPPFSSTRNESTPRQPAILRRGDEEEPKSFGRFDNNRGSASPRVQRASPSTSRRTNPSALSPPTSRTNTFSPPNYNRSLSRGSNPSSDSAKSSPRFARPTPPRSSRPPRNRPAEDEVPICPKALSTIESFFNF